MDGRQAPSWSERQARCARRFHRPKGTSRTSQRAAVRHANGTSLIKQSRPTACGWMGHYDGMTVEQMDALRKANKLGLKEAFFLNWSCSGASPRRWPRRPSE